MGVNMEELDILSYPFIEIQDSIILSDKRILVLYLYKYLCKYSNVSYYKQKLHIEGCSCLIRADAKKINFHPSYQKGHGRVESDDGFESTKDDTDFFIIAKVLDRGVVLIPISSKDVKKPKSSLEDLCQD
jgi:hypothetical protein